MLKNNVFVNTRIGPGIHYAVGNAVAAAASTWISSSSNYNNLYSYNANHIAEWGPDVSNTFAQFQSNSGGDANSLSRRVKFYNG